MVKTPKLISCFALASCGSLFLWRVCGGTRAQDVVDSDVPVWGGPGGANLKARRGWRNRAARLAYAMKSSISIWTYDDESLMTRICNVFAKIWETSSSFKYVETIMMQTYVHEMHKKEKIHKHAWDVHIQCHHQQIRGYNNLIIVCDDTLFQIC